MIVLPPVLTAVEEDCTSGLVIEVFLFVCFLIRLAHMLYFFMVAHKATCQTLFKALVKSMEAW